MIYIYIYVCRIVAIVFRTENARFKTSCRSACSGTCSLRCGINRENPYGALEVVSGVLDVNHEATSDPSQVSIRVSPMPQ